MNSPPILGPILISGDWDVHWGYDLDFDPWPYAPSDMRAPVQGAVGLEELCLWMGVLVWSF